MVFFSRQTRLLALIVAVVLAVLALRLISGLYGWDAVWYGSEARAQGGTLQPGQPPGPTPSPPQPPQTSPLPVSYSMLVAPKAAPFPLDPAARVLKSIQINEVTPATRPPRLL